MGLIPVRSDGGGLLLGVEAVFVDAQARTSGLGEHIRRSGAVPVPDEDQRVRAGHQLSVPDRARGPPEASPVRWDVLDGHTMLARPLVAPGVRTRRAAAQDESGRPWQLGQSGEHGLAGGTAAASDDGDHGAMMRPIWGDLHERATAKRHQASDPNIDAVLDGAAAGRTQMQIVFLHGLESGPKGSKFRSLAAAFPNVGAPDTEGVVDVNERLRCIESELAGRRNLLLVGSSFGGLMACLFVDRHPHRVAGCVLLAPALHDRVAQWVASIRRVPERCIIIHGLRDDIVPIAASRVCATRFGVELTEVDDGHRLANSHEIIVAATRRLLNAS